MQVFFIRHAQSQNNALYARTGSSLGRSEDPGLSELGLVQAARLTDFLVNGRGACMDGNLNSEFNFTHIYSSLMVRAVHTGSQIAQSLDLPLYGWLDLHECGGVYQEDIESGETVGLPGRPRDYFEQEFARLIPPDELTQQGWWNRPKETREERMPRARRVLQRLNELHAGTQDRVALVSHGGFFKYFVCALLGLPDEGNIWFSTNNASVSRFDMFSGEVDVVYINRFDYLPPELIS